MLPVVSVLLLVRVGVQQEIHSAFLSPAVQSSLKCSKVDDCELDFAESIFPQVVIPNSSGLP